MYVYAIYLKLYIIHIKYMTHISRAKYHIHIYTHVYTTLNIIYNTQHIYIIHIIHILTWCILKPACSRCPTTDKSARLNSTSLLSLAVSVIVLLLVLLLLLLAVVVSLVLLLPPVGVVGLYDIDVYI